jgi:uncharacterized protein
VTRFLFDVNLLVTMHLPGSNSFSQVQHWFSMIGSKNFATCAITQAGFIRVSTQLAVIGGAIDVSEAKVALQRLTARSEHAYWPIDISYLEAVEPFETRMLGYRQITDAYLLGLAIHHRGKLATLDRAIVHLAGPKFAEYVELIA